jgi:hypothetical protein
MAASAPSYWRKMRFANGWQLCMAVYGLTFGARLLWPNLTGLAEVQTTALELGAIPTILGILVLVHSILSGAALILADAREIMRAMLVSLGAMLWTTVGLIALISELKNGYAPTLGLFYLLGGVGLFVSLIQRARDPLG